MKALLKKIDIIYILGLLIMLMGYYFEDRIFISGDFLYGLSSVFTPIVVDIFILGGIATIVVELLLTKKLGTFYRYLIKNKAVFILIIVTLVLYVITLRQLPVMSYVLSTLAVLTLIMGILIIKTHWIYTSVLLVYIIYYSEKIIWFFTGDPYAYREILSSLIITVILSLVFVISLTAYRYIKKKSILPYIIFLSVFVLSLSSLSLLDGMYDTHYQKFDLSYSSGYPGFCQNQSVSIVERFSTGGRVTFDGNLAQSFTITCNNDGESGVVSFTNNTNLNLTLSFILFPGVAYFTMVNGQGIEILKKKTKKEV